MSLIYYCLIGASLWAPFEDPPGWANPEPGWIVSVGRSPEIPNANKYGDWECLNTTPGTWQWKQWPAPVMVLDGVLTSDEDKSPITIEMLPGDVAGRLTTLEGLSSPTWSSLPGKPSFSAVATSGAYSSLTGIPSTFAPSAHNQAWSTITATPTTLAGYGVTDGVTSAALSTALSSYATTAALTSGLSGKFNAPAGTMAQYVRGDGALATLPVARRIETYTGTTNALGQITVTYSTAFPVTPTVQPEPPALASQVWTVVNSTATGFTLQLSQRNTVAVLGFEVLLGATAPVNGAAARVLVVAQ